MPVPLSCVIYFSQCDEMKKSGPPRKAGPTGGCWFLRGFLFYDLEAGGDGRGVDSLCRGAGVVGLDGAAGAGCCTGDAAGAIRVFRLGRGDRASRVSVLDDVMRATSHFCAVAHGC